MKWLCCHLGHTQKVHEQDGRSTSGLIEQLNVAKLMLIQEGNVHGKIQEKSLNDIAFEGRFSYIILSLLILLYMKVMQ